MIGSDSYKTTQLRGSKI